MENILQTLRGKQLLQWTSSCDLGTAFQVAAMKLQLC